MWQEKENPESYRIESIYEYRDTKAEKRWFLKSLKEKVRGELIENLG